MKVIAKINDGVVLCEVSAYEIARLKGIDNGIYDDKWRNEWVGVGAEHDMGTAFRTLDSLRKFDGTQLHNLKKRIDDMTESYQKILDAYAKLSLFDTLAHVGEELE